MRASLVDDEELREVFPAVEVALFERRCARFDRCGCSGSVDDVIALLSLVSAVVQRHLLAFSLAFCLAFAHGVDFAICRASRRLFA